ncbi:hypothetical protein SprV_0702450600 [Sparganum proliferum]
MSKHVTAHRIALETTYFDPQPPTWFTTTPPHPEPDIRTLAVSVGTIINTTKEVEYTGPLYVNGSAINGSIDVKLAGKPAYNQTTRLGELEVSGDKTFDKNKKFFVPFLPREFYPPPCFQVKTGKSQLDFAKTNPNASADTQRV